MFIKKFIIIFLITMLIIIPVFPDGLSDTLEKNQKKFTNNPESLTYKGKSFWETFPKYNTFDDNFRKKLEDWIFNFTSDRTRKESADKCLLSPEYCIDVYSYNGVAVTTLFCGGMYSSFIYNSDKWKKTKNVKWLIDYYAAPSLSSPMGYEFPLEEVLSPFLYAAALGTTLLMNEIDLRLIYCDLKSINQYTPPSEIEEKLSDAYIYAIKVKLRTEHLLKITYVIKMEADEVAALKSPKIIKNIFNPKFIPIEGRYLFYKRVNLLLGQDKDVCEPEAEKKLKSSNKILSKIRHPLRNIKAKAIVSSIFVRNCLYVNRVATFQSSPLFAFIYYPKGKVEKNLIREEYTYEEYKKYSDYAYSCSPSYKALWYYTLCVFNFIQDILLDIRYYNGFLKKYYK